MCGLDCRLSPVPSPDSKTRVAALVQQAVAKAFPDAGDVAIEVDRPKNPEHGDFTTNVALQLAKRVGKKPRETAEAITAALGKTAEIAATSIAGPGFINFTLAAASRFAGVKSILESRAQFGR